MFAGARIFSVLKYMFFLFLEYMGWVDLVGREVQELSSPPSPSSSLSLSENETEWEMSEGEDVDLAEIQPRPLRQHRPLLRLLAFHEHPAQVNILRLPPFAVLLQSLLVQQPENEVVVISSDNEDGEQEPPCKSWSSRFHSYTHSLPGSAEQLVGFQEVSHVLLFSLFFTNLCLLVFTCVTVSFLFVLCLLVLSFPLFLF